MASALLRIASALALAGGLALAGPGLSAATQGIRGYYNPGTRTFTPLKPRPAAGTKAPAALTTVSGTFKVTVNIRIDPRIPTNVKVGAGLTVTAQDPATYNPVRRYENDLSTDLTRNGAIGTASFTVTYVYELADPSAPVTFTLSLYEDNSNGGASTAFMPDNTRTQTLTLPANGATTLVSIGDSL